jgi:hypothetical protein
MRLSDWETRLSDYISEKRHEPFAYGKNDCCTFALGAAQAITGVDPMPEFRGKYDTLIGSVRALKEIGAGDLESTMDTKFPEIGIGFAQRGDLAFFDGSVGVVMGSFAWFVSDNGLERVPRSMWDKAWSVGRG